MKNNNVAILVVSIVLICVVVCIACITFAFRSNFENKLKEEEAQIELVTKIYKDFMDGIVDANKDSVVLDESALKNIATGEALSESGLKNLKKNVEIKNDKSGFNYILSAKYSNKTDRIVVTLTRDADASIGVFTQKYKIYIKDGKLEYKIDGEVSMATS